MSDHYRYLTDEEMAKDAAAIAHAHSIRFTDGKKTRRTVGRSARMFPVDGGGKAKIVILHACKNAEDAHVLCDRADCAFCHNVEEELRCGKELIVDCSRPHSPDCSFHGPHFRLNSR